MRGADIQQDTLFSMVIPDERVPSDHPLRPIREMVNATLKELDADFNVLYTTMVRDSLPPEKLLRAQLLMAFYTIRSERQLMEQIDYNLLFRWFVGFSMDDKVWDHSVFSKNRDRLLAGEVSHRFFAQVLSQAKGAGLLSKEHFSVDGTLIEAVGSHKSYRPKDEDGPPGGGGRNPTVDFWDNAVAVSFFSSLEKDHIKKIRI
jgi:transposase